MKADEALHFMTALGNHVRNTQGIVKYRYDKNLELVVEMGEGESEMYTMTPEKFLVECKDETFEAAW
jgi:hypothetical protein